MDFPASRKQMFGTNASRNTVRKLRSIDNLKEYEQVFNEWEDEIIIGVRFVVEVSKTYDSWTWIPIINLTPWMPFNELQKEAYLQFL
ncbi:hypothetical protein NPIL_93161 [Nephila pilipes]|uniref:Uncharacterized protein n=1 Tax=Nephila pilipes TaxID=299642 RepID=A0A8X6QLZ9_NEPPI|nr:hypothetical protein NPIL_93161 [Nephila pilipes]